MKTLLTALVTAIAIAAPAAEARVPTHHKTSQVSSGVHAKTGAKKTGKEWKLVFTEAKKCGERSPPTDNPLGLEESIAALPMTFMGTPNHRAASIGCCHQHSQNFSTTAPCCNRKTPQGLTVTPARHCR